jgi:hypothetical protein
MVIGMLVLYFAGMLLFPQRLSIPGAFWMLLVAFSPASMFLYERGNVDLIVFFLCILILLVAERSAAWASGLILFGAFVKVFPLFGVTVLLRASKRRFFLLAAICLIPMFVYWFLTLPRQSAVWTTYMRGQEGSYGTFVFLFRFNAWLQSSLPNFLAFEQWKLVFEVLALFLILLAMIPAVRNVQALQAFHGRNLAAFRMGASIYMGTFLLGNNWDYRLAFLVLVMPQLSEWLYAENKNHRTIAVGVLVTVILMCWHFVFLIDLPFLPFGDEIDRITAFDEVINWLLLAGFSYLLAASFPDWLRQDLQKALGVQQGHLPEPSMDGQPRRLPIMEMKL